MDSELGASGLAGIAAQGLKLVLQQDFRGIADD